MANDQLRELRDAKGLTAAQEYWRSFMALPASRWELLLARLLGRRTSGADNGMHITGYVWRGKLYVTKVRQERRAVQPK